MSQSSQQGYHQPVYVPSNYCQPTNAVAASISQGDIMFFSPESVGKQCVANSVVALLYASDTPCKHWTPTNLDSILFDGDMTYKDIQSKQAVRHPYLCTSDIPATMELLGKEYQLNIEADESGALSDFSQLWSSLEKSDKSTSTFALLIFGNQTSGTGSASAMIKQGGQYHIFDPHSRDGAGLPAPDRCAMLVTYPSLEQTFSYLQVLAQLLSADIFNLITFATTETGYLPTLRRLPQRFSSSTVSANRNSTSLGPHSSLTQGNEHSQQTSLTCDICFRTFGNTYNCETHRKTHNRKKTKPAAKASQTTKKNKDIQTTATASHQKKTASLPPKVSRQKRKSSHQILFSSDDEDLVQITKKSQSQKQPHEQNALLIGSDEEPVLSDVLSTSTDFGKDFSLITKENEDAQTKKTASHQKEIAQPSSKLFKKKRKASHQILSSTDDEELVQITKTSDNQQQPIELNVPLLANDDESLLSDVHSTSADFQNHSKSRKTKTKVARKLHFGSDEENNSQERPHPSISAKLSKRRHHEIQDENIQQSPSDDHICSSPLHQPSSTDEDTSSPVSKQRKCVNNPVPVTIPTQTKTADSSKKSTLSIREQKNAERDLRRQKREQVRLQQFPENEQNENIFATPERNFTEFTRINKEAQRSAHSNWTKQSLLNKRQRQNVEARIQMTPEQRSEAQEKERRRKASRKTQYTPEEQQILLERRRTRSMKARIQMTPEQRSEAQEKEKRRKASRKTQYTPEEQQILLERRRTRSMKARIQMTPEQRSEAQEKEKRRKASRKTQYTTEEQQQFLEIRRTRSREKRIQMTPAERLAEQENARTRQSTSRSQQSPEDRDQNLERRRDRRAEIQTQLTLNQRSAQREDAIQRQSRRRQVHRASELTPEMLPFQQYVDQQREVLIHDAGAQENQLSQLQQPRQRLRQTPTTIQEAMEKFHQEIQQGPTCVCTSCHRLLWRKSVIKLDFRRYQNFPELVRKIFSHNFIKFSIDQQIYVCKTCDKSIKEKKLPSQAKANSLHLDTIPEILAELNELEIRLISRRILFMMLKELPSGRQRGLKGPAVNVPANLGGAITLLPRIPSNMHIVTMEFKRRLQYKTNYLKDFIHPQQVMAALNYLKDNNSLYTDVTFNNEWLQLWQTDASDLYESAFSHQQSTSETTFANRGISEEGENDPPQQSNSGSQPPEPNNEDQEPPSLHDPETSSQPIQADHSEQSQPSEDPTSEEAAVQAYDESVQLRGLPHNTCIQQEIFTDHRKTYSLAPGEGNRPIPLLTDGNFEELANPEKFPKGTGGFNNPATARTTPLSLKQYINARLLDVDGRFAKDVNYLFALQYADEQKQLEDAVYVHLRKLRGNDIISNISAGTIRNPSSLQTLIMQDQAYRHLKNIRGSPPYWQNMFYDALGMIRHLGVATFFLTLSAADLRWPEVIQAIAAQYGQTLTTTQVINMPWKQRCNWLRSNPITAARMFQYRVDTFVTQFLKSPVHPIGVVKDYIIRVEFQQRGSPHVHCLFWIQGAPKLGEQSDDDVKKFIDAHISCHIPGSNNNSSLRTLVDELQRHKCNPRCTRKDKCRFNFPRPPSNITLISDEPTGNVGRPLEKARAILKSVQQVMKSSHVTELTTLEEILQKAKVTPAEYKDALSINASGRSIILQRQPHESNVNNYSPVILSAWQANMDIQYVVNVYACVMYIASYVMKAEKGMSEMLKQAAKEMESEAIRTKLRKLGSVFLNNRELSAQEATYRALSLPLRKFSRQVIFINTDEEAKRVRLLLPLQALANKEDEDEDIFCKNILDRYPKRPPVMNQMCLADFASNYRLTSTKPPAQDEDIDTNPVDVDDAEMLDTDGAPLPEMPKTIVLPDQLGTMQRRKFPAVLRWASHSKEKDPERFFHGRLMLFTAWRAETELLGNYLSYKDRYQEEMEQIKVREKQHIYISEQLEEVCDQLQQNGPPQAAWDLVGSDDEERTGFRPPEEENDSPDSPRPMDPEDLEANANLITCGTRGTSCDSRAGRYTAEIEKEVLTHQEYNSRMRHLNQKQRQVVVFHREWCKRTVASLNGNPEPIKPYFLFLSGPGGVGKSHIIEMIRADTVNYFRHAKSVQPKDVTILLTAATGVAAHNINGVTIHSAFSLTDRNTRKKQSKDKLSSSLLNTMRLELENLYVIIIDEVSMIGANMLLRLHNRLQEITELHGQDTRFGNLTIIAVGDLYQLPPVKDRKIFMPPSDSHDGNLEVLHGSIFQEMFLFHELTDVVRQQDPEFAACLNRVRTATITEEDDQLLQSRVIAPNDPCRFIDALQVFGTNKEADQYNSQRLNILRENTANVIYTVYSSDSRTDRETQQLTFNLQQLSRNETGGLATILQLSKNAIVKLTSNIDVPDGLANGARGKIQDIITRGTDVVAVLVEFFSASVGKKGKARSPYRNEHPNAVPISRVSNTFKVGPITMQRTQFPLVLSWASTVHSVQGLTVDQIVVDLTKVNHYGQAYVALSRVKTITGLQIINYNKTKIKTDPAIVREMARLQQRAIIMSPPEMTTINQEENVNITHLNLNGFLTHLHDVKDDNTLQHTDIMCFTETHLRERDELPLHTLQWEHHQIFRFDRQGTSKGGILMVISPRFPSERCDLPARRLESEAITVSLPTRQLTIITVYRRAETISLDQTKHDIELMMTANNLDQHECLIVGDFNDPQGKLLSTLEQFGFQQLIAKPTTDHGAVLDFIFYNRLQNNPTTEVINTYYSDHDITALTLKL